MQTKFVLKPLMEFLSSVTGQTLTPDCDLIERGVIDSLTMMDLLTFVETNFGVHLDYADLTPETLGTLDALAMLVTARMPSTNHSQAA